MENKGRSVSKGSVVKKDERFKNNSKQENRSARNVPYFIVAFAVSVCLRNCAAFYEKEVSK